MHRRAFVATAALAAALPATATAQGAVEAAGQTRARAPRRPKPSAPDGGVSATIAAHVASSSYAALDEATIRAAKLRLIDLVGCAIGGVRGEGGAALASVIVGTGTGQAGASVLGTGKRAPARDAAMANAVLARTFDYEVMTVVVDGIQVPSHHSPTTVMTALALAEQHRVDGRTFLTALAVGDDLAARTLAASGIDFNDGWDGAPLHSTMAAAAIAARIARLDADRTRHALALAADTIHGTVQSIWDGGNAWKVQQGSAARNGILAAELAATGWSGMADPLLAPCGFYGQFTPGAARPELLTKALGRDWHGEVYFKPWPSCAANHPTIECAITLRDREKLAPRDIASVRLHVAPHILNLFIAKPLGAGPSAHSQANFNIYFACATALLHGDLRQEHYLPAALNDPALRTLIARTTLVALPPGGRGVIVEVTRTDGTVVTQALPGKPRHYPDVAGSTAAEVEAKFRRQVAFAGTVSDASATAILRRIGTIDTERDMAGFARLLADTIRFPKV